MKITAIYGSPRKDGNTDLLLQSFLSGLRNAGEDAREIFLRDLNFSACIACGGCDATGTCVLEDDLEQVYPHLVQADVIVLAAPVFFYGLNAQAKAMVDRCQCLWVKKYVLNNRRRQPCRGMFLSAGGSGGKKNFEGTLLTVRYFFDALDSEFSQHLTYGDVDAKGAIKDHPAALDDAYRLGNNVPGALAGR